MKNDLDGVVALAHSNGASTGTVTEAEIDEAVGKSNKSRGVSVMWSHISDTAPVGGASVSSYVLRARHAEVPDLDVYYFFNNVGSHVSGEPVTAPVNSVIPSGGSVWTGTPLPPPAGGGGGGAGGDVLGTPVECGGGKFTPVGNITITCLVNGPWGGDRVQPVLTLTPTSPVLGHWKVIADLSAITTMTQVKVSGPSGYSPAIDGKPDMGNEWFLDPTFVIEGATNNSPSSSPNNHWDISTAKSPEKVLIDIDY
jgi:hypothetical protein